MLGNKKSYQLNNNNNDSNNDYMINTQSLNKNDHNVITTHFNF